jgi:undecaprenyl phosphate-alpha-L-ara4N flippase subunit ArnE
MSVLLLLVACALTCLGQIAQKYAVEQWRTGSPSIVARLITPWFMLALASLGLGLVVWLMVLQRLEVGIAYPMLSLNFVLITLVARFIFREPIDSRHWVGVTLITGGVVCLGWQV